jgi:hypothetical protein
MHGFHRKERISQNCSQYFLACFPLMDLLMPGYMRHELRRMSETGLLYKAACQRFYWNRLIEDFRKQRTGYCG